MAVPPSPSETLARQLAEREAVLAGQTLVGPEHVLVALGSRDLESGPSTLGAFGLTDDQLRMSVLELSDGASAQPIGRLGFSVLAERAFYNARVFAERDGSVTQHRHLLAGVLSVDAQNVTRAVNKLGVTVPELQRVLGLGPVPAARPPAYSAPGTNDEQRLALRVDDLVDRVDRLSTLVENLLVGRRAN